MADHYRVERDAGPGQSFGSRLGDSIKGILFGIVIFVLAFPLLWWGENRKNEAEFIDEAQMISSDATPGVKAGTLIKTTGPFSTTENLNDALFLNASGNQFLTLNRKVEMYAWVENKKTKKEGKKEVTTYDYEKKWVSSPQDSGKFYDASNHANPIMTEKSEHFKVGNAQIGKLTFDADKTTFHGTKDLTITEDMTNKAHPKGLQVVSGQIYIPHEGKPKAPALDPYSFSATPTPPPAAARNVTASPEVGDLRVTYTFFPANSEGSLSGSWDGNKIVPHVYDKSNTFLGAYNGGLAEFRAELEHQYKVMSWVIRIAALLMMWGGLNGILGPVLLFIDVIPVVGGVGRSLISLITGAIAFVLWGLTLLLANLWLVLLVSVILIAGIVFLAKKKSPAAVA
jgi:hypothetical protein